jgi:hypothetical protein
MEALCDTVLEIYGIDLDNEVAYEAVRRAEITAASGKVGGWCSWRCKTTIPAIPDIEDPITFEFRVDESPEVLSYNDD